MLRQELRVGVLLCLLYSSAAAMAQEFRSAWPKDVERVWVGPEYWANRLQDWQINDGRLECTEARTDKPMRTVHLLTRRLGAKAGGFIISVRTGLIGEAASLLPDSATGFLVGAGSELDYRAAALIHHSAGPGAGLFAGIDGSGRLFIRDFSKTIPAKDLASQAQGTGIPKDVELRLSAEPVGGKYKLMLTSHEPKSDRQLGSITLEGVDPARLIGNLALVSHPGSGEVAGRFWFRDWKVSGSKVEVHDDRLCGPVLCTQYTLSRNILKMTAQMMPLGQADNQTAALQIQQDGQWKTIATTNVIVPGYTAPFRIENWDLNKDTPYRVVYDLKQTDGTTKPYFWSGTVRREPVDKPTIVVAAFTGNHNVRRFPGWIGVDGGTFPWTAEAIWFPHNDIVEHVAKYKPDLLFFSGDQIYETASPTAAEKAPGNKAQLDYLYKWYLWCWAFGDIARDIPCVCIPDDHDVYQGNIWGAGGRVASVQDDGGYIMPPEWVNMVQRTQTSHLPDPYDPTPIEQGIGVYYTSMNYGGVSFAIIEDRKWKSSPTKMVPAGKVVNGWAQDPNFNPAKEADVPGAKLLGDGQLNFLRNWSADWSNGAWMKVVLSQTIFANVATLPRDATSDNVVPGLKRLAPGDYPKNDKPVADMDSNGWPQTGRNKALREMRRGFAFHIAGDQHLGSTIQYGVEDWNDAGFALCVPSIANFWPRRWFPPVPGRNRKPGWPKYTGEYQDGFGNRMTVYAVSNPTISGHQPAFLHDRAPGYGIVRLNKKDRTITMECWPRYADPTNPKDKQYPGWPITIKQADNYGRKAEAYLPTIKVNGITNPVVQIIDEANGEVVYTLRIKGTSFGPKVFRAGLYTIKVGEPDIGKMKTLTGVQSIEPEESQTVEVNF